MKQGGEGASLYDVLGVPRDADPETIKKAHRRKAREHHPDKGGNRDAFEKVQGAWLVLSSPDKRERYDRTGESDDGPIDNKLATIAGHLMRAFDTAIVEAGAMLEQRDLVALMRRIMQGERRMAQQQRAGLKNDLERMRKLLPRIRFTGAGFDPIGNELRARLAAAERSMLLADREIADFVEAIAYLDHYGFDFDRPPPMPSYTAGGFASISLNFTA